jgi:hypothetical protein
MPAKAGIHVDPQFFWLVSKMDSRFRGNDGSDESLIPLEILGEFPREP